MGMPLFREESEEARANAWLGRVLLTRPLSFTLLTWVSTLIVLILAGLFSIAEYTRKARVLGVLAPTTGVVKIVSSQAGVVQSIHAPEGATVDRDSPILTITDPRTGSANENVAVSVAAHLAARMDALIAQRQYALDAMRAEQATIARRREAVERELALLEGEFATQGQRTLLARQALERSLGLEMTGFVSPAAVDRERDASLEHVSRTDALRRTRIGLNREAESAEFEARSSFARAHAQIAAIDLQIAALDQERIERQLQYGATLAAPTPGVIATVLVEPGQSIMPGTTVATLMSADARLEVHLFAPSRSIGFVRPGQAVLLRFLAYPHQKFGLHSATITAVASNPMPPSDLGYSPPDGNREPLYRIKAVLTEQTITAYGKREPLQAGMQVEADIHLDRRRLIEWIFEPVLGLAGRA
jgi:membrane fusion protein